MTRSSFFFHDAQKAIGSLERNLSSRKTTEPRNKQKKDFFLRNGYPIKIIIDFEIVVKKLENLEDKPIFYKKQFLTVLNIKMVSEKLSRNITKQLETTGINIRTVKVRS